MPEPNTCIVCGEDIPLHHTCIVIQTDSADISEFVCAHISCQDGIEEAMEDS